MRIIFNSWKVIYFKKNLWPLITMKGNVKRNLTVHILLCILQLAYYYCLGHTVAHDKKINKNNNNNLSLFPTTHYVLKIRVDLRSTDLTL